MIGLVVDKDGTEILFVGKVFKDPLYGIWRCGNIKTTMITLDKGTIKKTISRELTWNDKPVRLGEVKNEG